MKRLVLLGGGHAHVKVLADLREHPLAGWDTHLISPYPRQIYSGMLPGWIAGHYDIEDCAIRLDDLAARAAVAHHRTAGSHVDFARSAVVCVDGSEVHFDALAIDTGPVASLDSLPGARQNALPIRPIEDFVRAWPGLVDRILGRCRRYDLVILGGGAAGVELAFAIHRRAMRDGWSHLRLCVAGPGMWPMDSIPSGARQRVANAMARKGIEWMGLRRARSVFADHIAFEDGDLLPFDACLIANGAAAPSWPRASGLATDADGFISVGPTLQSTSHPNVFAAGDVAAYHDSRPKSGVFAVRAGPILSSNLRAYCNGAPLQRWKPQTRALYLISTGDRSAIASWGRWSWGGRWVWNWKDRIDRRFMARFAPA
jgi:selenide,water dikinase